MEARSEEKLRAFLKDYFPILLIGERGTGKSKLVGDLNAVWANCASFANDTMAEAELFGYKKGSFTGADTKKDRDGLFQEANGGILFMDEIHHLSKPVQAKLMHALQPDTNNDMYVRKFGSTTEEKVKFKLIAASNRKITKLREALLADFFDRIVRHVIELPPLRAQREKIEEHWEMVWKQLKFDKPVPKEVELMAWLKDEKQRFWGNFRDLEKIATYYNIYDSFENKNSIAKNAFEYAVSEFEKYGSTEPEDAAAPNSNMKLDLTKTAAEIHRDFNFELQAFAINRYGSREEAAKKLAVDERTLMNWKNRK
jgi:transcriptional regulator with PAS, ATPase and Fis domain